MGATTSARSVTRALSLALSGALLLVAIPARSEAASAVVRVKDNRYEPEVVRIDPGDTVVWRHEGAQDHTVTSDVRGQFDSGRMRPGDVFRHTFDKEGYYDYFCKLHGASGGTGMAGTVVVGNPPPRADEDDQRNRRPKIVVPDDYRSIQKAVDNADPGSKVVIKPGVYRQRVVVKTPRLLIEGVDRFRTVLHGKDKLGNGILVDGVGGVKIRNLTVRNYTGNGIFYIGAHNYEVTKVDAIKNRTYGVYAYQSYNGVIRDSFGWGSGDSAFYIGECMACSGLVDDVVAQYSYIGYSGTNATGVVIRDSVFKRNGVGIVPNTLPTEDLGPNRGTVVINNLVKNNNYKTVPASGFSERVGIPFGTGIWLAGVQNNVVRGNVVKRHDRYGVLVTQSVHDDPLPMNNEVIANFIRNSDSNEDGYGYALAWDGSGADNCFADNDFNGPTGPPDIETLYHCDNRPFAGVPYPPVQADVAASLASSQTREQKEPPEPKRPRCQKGKPGCDR